MRYWAAARRRGDARRDKATPAPPLPAEAAAAPLGLAPPAARPALANASRRSDAGEEFNAHRRRSMRSSALRGLSCRMASTLVTPGLRAPTFPWLDVPLLTWLLLFSSLSSVVWISSSSDAVFFLAAIRPR